jgi:hypothetical protein
VPAASRAVEAPAPRLAPDQELLGEEIVLEQEDEFGRPRRGAETVAGQLLVALGYVAMVVGALVLPWLAL